MKKIQEKEERSRNATFFSSLKIFWAKGKKRRQVTQILPVSLFFYQADVGCGMCQEARQKITHYSQVERRVGF